MQDNCQLFAAGDDAETILQGYRWLEPDDLQACLVHARRLVGHERVEPFILRALLEIYCSIPAFGVIQAMPRFSKLRVARSVFSSRLTRILASLRSSIALHIMG
jgi:hypothetical protein